MIRSIRLPRPSRLLPWLAFHITNDLLALTHNLVNDLLRLCAGFLHGLDVGAFGSPLGCSGGSGGGFGLGDASCGDFLGAWLGGVGFCCCALFGRDGVLDGLDDAGLGVAFREMLGEGMLGEGGLGGSAREMS